MKGQRLFCILLILVNVGLSKQVVAETVVRHERIFHTPAYEARRQDIAREDSKKAQDLERKKAEDATRAEEERKKAQELERKKKEETVRAEEEKKRVQELERKKEEEAAQVAEERKKAQKLEQQRASNDTVPAADKNINAVRSYNASNVFVGKSTYTYDGKNENDAYTAALLDAKRAAIEQAGTHIQASSEINNFQLTSDKVRSLSSAIVKLLPDSVEKKILSRQGDTITVELSAAFQVELDNLNTIAITLWPQVPKAKLKDKINSDAYRTPSPMTFQEAERYSKNFPDDIIYHTFKKKDKFGNKNRIRIFDFLNKKGVYHSGSTITGVGDTSAIRFSIDYGFENRPSTPIASIGWSIGTTGDWGTFRPQFINFVFDEGDTITIPLEKVNFNAQVNYGIFVNSILKKFHGVVKLSPQNLYELSIHRQLQAAYISNSSGGLVHLFYSGDKDKKEKDDLMRGFIHASKMLDITYETVNGWIKLQQDTIEAQRRSALLESVNKEIERDKLKEKILTEIDNNSN